MRHPRIADGRKKKKRKGKEETVWEWSTEEEQARAVKRLQE